MGSADLPAAAVDHASLRFEYRRSADQDAPRPVRHAVVVVGAGPVGLSLAIDLAGHDVEVVVLDDDCKLATGSRAICFAKRTLEIFDRLGCGQRITRAGIAWNVGRVFFGDRQVYQFDLLSEAGHERPAFVNVPQYDVEGLLLERAGALPQIDLRWQQRVVGCDPHADGATLRVETPDGDYALEAAYLVACDGSRSTVRRLIGESFDGRVFNDRFLIADVEMQAPFPAERWFWFDPPFHRHQSVLLHRQPGNLWRVDFQLGSDADADAARKPENIVPRIRAMLAASGHADTPFELRWASVYTFSCARMRSFRHGRVLFAGDSAHCVSPFGARGANSGIQDVDNLAWKLAQVVRGKSPDSLLDTYASEREAAADENIRHSSRSTDFITPKSAISRMFRDAVLDLSAEHGFARALVNSGRLSTPSTLVASPLNTPDVDAFAGGVAPGAPAVDAPLLRGNERTWLLRELGGDFTLLVYGEAPVWSRELPLRCVAISPAEDAEGLVARRYAFAPGAACLIRPDQHVCARWLEPSRDDIVAALERACGPTAARPSEAPALATAAGGP